MNLLAHPILTAQQEQELIARIHQGDVSAQDELIRHNEKLVYKIAKRYIDTASRDVELEDLLQEGRMGLLRAAKKWSFKVAKKRNVTKFSTYATWWIHQTIRRRACRHRSGFSRSFELDDLSYTVNKVKSDLLEKLQREPTPEEIIEACNIKPSKVRLILLTPKLVNLDYNHGELDSEPVHERLADPNANVEDVSVDAVVVEQYIQRLESELPRHALVLRMLYGINREHRVYTAAEISRKLGVTRERVRQLREAAFDFLRT